MKNNLLTSYFRQLRQSPAGDKVRPDSPLSLLIGSEGCDYIERLTEWLGFLDKARNFGLECPLGGKEKRGDFFACLTRAQWAGVPPVFGNECAWQRIADFAAWWTKAQDQAALIRDEIWVEFDLAKPPVAVPVPNFFFGIFGQKQQDYFPAVVAGLTALGVSMPGSQARLLAQCLQFFAPVCTGFQIGVMLSRVQAPLRLCAFSVAAEDLQVILATLGRNPFAGVSDWEPERLQLGGVYSAVDLDIGMVLGNKVGLEIDLSPIHSVRAQRHSTQWPELVNRLEKCGWSEKERGQGVLSWPGGWHCGSADAWLQTGPVLLRTISHIKLDFQLGLPPKAKAYLHYIVR